MFTQTWREHWGLVADPFGCEDADKDDVLSKIEMAAVHSGFDRVFGVPTSPSPGIVFGEKGSGKSGLRLMMRRRLEAHNAAQPDSRVFVVEYCDFDSQLESLQRALSKGSKRADIDAVINAWKLSDHLDAILSLGISRLVDGLIDGSIEKPPLSAKQTLDLHLLTCLYYRSKAHTPSEAIDRLERNVGASGRAGGGSRVLLSLVGLGLIALPHLVGIVDGLSDLSFLAEQKPVMWGVGAAIGIVPWILDGWRRGRRRRNASDACGAVRVLPRDPVPLERLLARTRPQEAGEVLLPHGTEEALRFEYLQRFLALLDATGHHGLYVLVDRVDEPTLLAAGGDRMRSFVQSMLDIKLLQHPSLALKLFLPIEMETLWRSASPEELKRMRLDKSNLVPELKWTGRELYEIANRRLRACSSDGAAAQSVGDLLGPDLDERHLLDTLSSLGTPRYAFGFLSEVLLQHVTELPDDLSADDGRWRLSRAGFDVVRAAWIDRAGILRRTLN